MVICRVFHLVDDLKDYTKQSFITILRVSFIALQQQRGNSWLTCVVYEKSGRALTVLLSDSTGSNRLSR